MIFERLIIHTPIDVKLSHGLTSAASDDVDVTPDIGNIDFLYFSYVFAGNVKVVGYVTIGDVNFDIQICDVFDP